MSAALQLLMGTALSTQGHPKVTDPGFGRQLWTIRNRSDNEPIYPVEFWIQLITSFPEYQDQKQHDCLTFLEKVVHTVHAESTTAPPGAGHTEGGICASSVSQAWAAYLSRNDSVIAETYAFSEEPILHQCSNCGFCSPTYSSATALEGTYLSQKHKRRRSLSTQASKCIMDKRIKKFWTSKTVGIG